MKDKDVDPIKIWHIFLAAFLICAPIMIWLDQRPKLGSGTGMPHRVSLFCTQTFKGGLMQNLGMKMIRETEFTGQYKVSDIQRRQQLYKVLGPLDSQQFVAECGCQKTSSYDAATYSSIGITYYRNYDPDTGELSKQLAEDQQGTTIPVPGYAPPNYMNIDRLCRRQYGNKCSLFAGDKVYKYAKPFILSNGDVYLRDDEKPNQVVCEVVYKTKTQAALRAANPPRLKVVIMFEQIYDQIVEEVQALSD